MSKSPPKYVSMEGTILRLVVDTYYRDAGCWSVKFNILEGVIFVDSHSDINTKHLHGVELKPATKRQWLKDNEGYL